MGCSGSTATFDDSVYLTPTIADPFIMTEKTYQIRGSGRNVVSWIPKGESASIDVLGAKGIVLIAHGVYEHCLRYYSLAKVLTSKGFAVFGIDHYAHGKSEGLLGMVMDYRVLVDDFIEFGKIIQNENPGLPTFLLGQSLGTLVATLSCMSIPNLKAVLFCASAIVPGPAASSPFGIKSLYFLGQTSFAASLAGTMARVNPTGPAFPIVEEELTSDVAERAIRKRDPRCIHKELTCKTAYECLLMTSAAKEELSRVTLPLLCIHGSDDQVTLPAGSEFIMEHSATDPSLKNIQLYPGLRHELFHEKQPDSSEVMERVAQFFESHLPPAETETRDTAPTPAPTEMPAIV